MGKLRKYTGQRFQVQILGSVGSYGSTWRCVFMVFGKTKKVHGTVFPGQRENKRSPWGSVFQVQFSSSIGKLWKCLELFFQVQILGGHGKKKTTKEVHGTVFSGSLGKLRKCMALCF